MKWVTAVAFSLLGTLLSVLAGYFVDKALSAPTTTLAMADCVMSAICVFTAVPSFMLAWHCYVHMED